MDDKKFLGAAVELARQAEYLRVEALELEKVKKEEIAELESRRRIQYANNVLGSKGLKSINLTYEDGLKYVNDKYDKEIKEAKELRKQILNLDNKVIGLPQKSKAILDRDLEKSNIDFEKWGINREEIKKRNWSSWESSKKKSKLLVEKCVKALDREKEIQALKEQEEKLEQFREYANDILTPPTPPSHEREPLPENDDDPPPKTPGRSALKVPDTTKAEEIEKAVQKRLERLRRLKELNQELGRDQEIE